MNRNYARLISGLFCGCLSVVVAASALTPDKSFSELENRTLAQRPALSLDDFRLAWPVKDSGRVFTGEFMSEFETYVTDQFPARDAWVGGKAWLEKLTGKQENNGVYFCDDATLIPKFTEESWDESRLTRNLSMVASFAEKAGVPVAFGLIPTQATVWAEKLPDNAPNYDQKQILDRAAAEVTGAVPVDFYTTLMAHQSEPIYYRTDHHWTSLGAYYGYAALGSVLGYTPVSLDSLTKTTVSTEFYGTTFSNSGVRWVAPDEMDIYIPETDTVSVTSYRKADAAGNMVGESGQLYDESFLQKKDKYSMFLGGNQALCKIQTGLTGKPKLLIVRDSYADSLVPFLTQHFSEIHLIDLRYLKRPAVSEYIQQNGIDQVLVLYSVPNFVSDPNLPVLR